VRANHSRRAADVSILKMMREGASERVGYGVAFASREFRSLFASQLVSVSGTSIAAVALTIVVYRRTESPLLASLTFALGFLPYLLGGGLLSSVIDRVRPRRLMTSCECASSFLAGAMAWRGMPVVALLTLLLVIGTLSSVSSGGRAALVRATVSEAAYVPARSLLRIAAQIAQIGGNAGGGALLVILSPSGALLVNAGSFAFSAATIRFGLRDHANSGERGRATVVRDSLQGARAILSDGDLRRLLLVGWLAPMFAVAPEALAAPYIAGRHGSPALVGWWLVALPLGTIVGDVAGVRLLGRTSQRRVVAPLATAGFVPYLFFVLAPSVPIALGLLVASGACGLYMLGLDSRVRDAAPDYLFARTMTLYSAGLMTLQGVGFTLAGAIAQAVGSAAAIAIAGALGLTATVTLLHSDYLPPVRAMWASSDD
jgi:hypothetical protein